MTTSSVAGVPGLEPRLTEPESVGLPITPYPIDAAGAGTVLYPTPDKIPNGMALLQSRHWVRQLPDSLDPHHDRVAGQDRADSGWCAGEHDITGKQCHHVRDV